MRPFERFAAGRAAHELTLAVYRASALWPTEERYGLTVQARRAAVSIGANLCEGAARQGARELRRYVDMARGSHGELQYLLQVAGDLGYTAKEDRVALEEAVRKAGVLLWKLYSAVRKGALAES